MTQMPGLDIAGEQLPVLYYKEGERLSELANFVREGSEQLVEVRCQIWRMRLQHHDCTYDAVGGSDAVMTPTHTTDILVGFAGQNTSCEPDKHK